MVYKVRRPLALICAVAMLWLLAAQGAWARGPSVDTRDLHDWLGRAQGQVFLLDVRTPREFAMGRIPGSVLIPMNQIPRRVAEIPRDQKVVVVCATGARSGAVTRYLSQQGYGSVFNYSGGVSAWARSGHPLER